MDQIVAILLSLFIAYLAPPRPVERLTPELREWASRTRYWQRFLERCYIEVCRARARPRYAASWMSWPRDNGETGGALALRLGVPRWVLDALNRGYDLDQLSDGQMLVIPAVAPITRHCVDPIRITSLHHDPEP